MEKHLYGGQCDICQRRDGFKGHNMQKCVECGVLVHEACYGLIQTTKGVKRRNWCCRACELKGEQPDGRRPHVCVLCSVSDGTHAMHPLYDRDGPSGKHLMRRSGPAWVHTLCAVFLGSFRNTRGCVYACDAAGDFDGAEEAVDEGSCPSDGDSELRRVEVHHYVICGPADPRNRVWYERVKLFRKELVCSTCKQKDSASNVLRIAVQCCSGDEGELVSLKREGKVPCIAAMHVGCAQWRGGAHKRVFCWPGTVWNDGEEETRRLENKGAGNPICEIYCNPCASEVFNEKKRSKSADKRAADKENGTAKSARRRSVGDLNGNSVLPQKRRKTEVKNPVEKYSDGRRKSAIKQSQMRHSKGRHSDEKTHVPRGDNEPKHEQRKQSEKIFYEKRHFATKHTQRRQSKTVHSRRDSESGSRTKDAAAVRKHSENKPSQRKQSQVSSPLPVVAEPDSGDEEVILSPNRPKARKRLVIADDDDDD